MSLSLAWPDIAALAAVMIAGAAIPGVSVLAVSARSASLGFAHGAWVTLGIVAGDLLFIAVALYGLATLAQLTASHFAVVQYLGAAYLFWLGIVLWRDPPAVGPAATARESSRRASALMGLLITLGDQKAILFYLGFLPAFVDLRRVSLADAAALLALAAVTVGGPKLFYAFVAARAGSHYGGARYGAAIRRVAAGLMVAVGAVLVLRA